MCFDTVLNQWLTVLLIALTYTNNNSGFHNFHHNLKYSNERDLLQSLRLVANLFYFTLYPTALLTIAHIYLSINPVYLHLPVDSRGQLRPSSYYDSVRHEMTI